MTAPNEKTEETASLTDPLHSSEPDVGNVAAALGDAYHADGLSGAYYLEATDSLARVNARLEAARAYASSLREPMPAVFKNNADRLAWVACDLHGRELLAILDGTGETP